MVILPALNSTRFFEAPREALLPKSAPLDMFAGTKGKLLYVNEIVEGLAPPLYLRALTRRADDIAFQDGGADHAEQRKRTASKRKREREEKKKVTIAHDPRYFF